MLKRLFASNKRPYFKESSPWDKLDFDLSGCKFQISLPPQDYEFPEKLQKSNLNIFEKALFDYETEPDRHGFLATNKGFIRSSVFTRNWFSYGPVWRSRNIGSLQCALMVCDTSQMEANLNCFCAEQMERLILQDLYYSDGPGINCNENRSPVNWRVEDLKNTKWVYLESWPKTAEWDDNPSSYKEANFNVQLATPIFDSKYLIVSFSGTGSLPAKPSTQMMFERIRNIISTMKIELSPEGNKHKVEAEHRYPNAKYSKSRIPEVWKFYDSYRKGSPFNGEPSVVFEGKPSPPPKIF